MDEAKQRENEAEKFKSVFEYQSDLTFASPAYEKNILAKDPDLTEKRKAWHKSLSRDLYVSEALNVLSELKLRTPIQLVKK